MKNPLTSKVKFSRHTVMGIMVVMAIVATYFVYKSFASGSDIVNVAAGQVGVHEGANNCNPYGPCEPWCVDFVSWAYSHAGYGQFGAQHSVDAARAQLKNLGWYHGHDGAPNPGDIIMYGSVHAGIVDHVSGSTIYSIEGNYSDQVSRVTTSLGAVTDWGGPGAVAGGGSSGAPKMDMLGRVWNNSAGGQSGGSGAKVFTCGWGDPVTDGNGYFHVIVDQGKGFCVRPENFNGYALGTGTTYENQIANSSHGGYDFQITSGLNPSNFTVVGRFFNSPGNPGGAGAGVDTCGWGQHGTDSNGFYSFNVPQGMGFCVHPTNYNAKTMQPQGDQGPGAKGYEWQIAGFNCYHVCKGVAPYNWDRDGRSGNGDFGYDLQIIYSNGGSPAPAPAPQPSGGGGSISAPSGLHVVSKTSTTVTLAWNAVAGATGYKVILGGNVIGTGRGTSMTINGLHAGNSYTFYVKSYNSSGASAKSGGVTVRI